MDSQQSPRPKSMKQFKKLKKVLNNLDKIQKEIDPNSESKKINTISLKLLTSFNIKTWSNVNKILRSRIRFSWISYLSTFFRETVFKAYNRFFCLSTTRKTLPNIPFPSNLMETRSDNEIESSCNSILLINMLCVDSSRML